jgi:hypothetical protein
MSAIPYVCPHCGANQFLAYGKGLATDGYRDLAVVGLPDVEGAAIV